MILIPQKLIIEESLGINMAAFMARMTEVSNRTIADDLKGKRIMRSETRKKMHDDMRAWIVENVTDNLSADVVIDQFIISPDDEAAIATAQKHPWSNFIRSFEEGILLRYKGTGSCNQEARIFPLKSIEELRAMEDINYAISKAFSSKDWTSARDILLAEWERVPLLHASVFKAEKGAFAKTDSSEKFHRFCSVLALNSVMYMLALVDLGFSHNGNVETAQSIFADLVSALDNQDQRCPVRAWIDGIGAELGLNGTNALGNLFSQWKNVDDETGARELKRWRSGGVIPHWDTAIFICDRLSDNIEDAWLKHISRYGAARVLQKLHEHCTRVMLAKGREDVLKMFYDEYPKWYGHHQHLNAKAPA